jgi:hypothetical protein
VPFLAILWILTSTLEIKGAAVAWSLRGAADALALFWISGINRRDVLSALRPAALLAASEVGAWFVGSRLGLALPAAILVDLIGLGLSYACSPDWRQLIDAQFGGRARRFTGRWFERVGTSGSP